MKYFFRMNILWMDEDVFSTHTSIDIISVHSLLEGNYIVSVNIPFFDRLRLRHNKTNRIVGGTLSS